MKRMIGILSVVVTGSLLVPNSNVHAATQKEQVTSDRILLEEGSVTADTKPFKVVIPVKHTTGKPKIIGFDTKLQFETYIKDHSTIDTAQTLRKSTIVTPTIYRIKSDFYYDANLSGKTLSFKATTNLRNVINLDSLDRKKISSIHTHPFGGYTIVYEHPNAQGDALAIVNNGGSLNLLDVNMGDGARTWDNQMSSTIVSLPSIPGF